MLAQTRATSEHHWQEKHLTFLEGPHIYYWKKKPVRTSATGINKKYFTGFDGAAIVNDYWEVWKNSKTNKYAPLIRYLMYVQGETEQFAKNAIIALWSRDGRVAADYGTKMHQQFEMACLEQVIPDDELMPEVAPFRKWLARFLELGGWQIWQCEYMLVKLDAAKNVALWCGSVDLILKHVKTPNVYCAIDYKSTDPKGGANLLGISRSPFSKGCGLFPFGDVVNADSGKYTVQLNVYAHTLYEDYGMDARDHMYVVQCHKTLDRPHVYHVPRLDYEMKTLTALEEEQTLLEQNESDTPNPDQEDDQEAD